MGEIGIAQVVLMGLVTVFVVLICLIIIIKLMGAIMVKAAPAEQAEAAVPAPAAAPAAAPAVSGNSRLSQPSRSRSLRKWGRMSRISASTRSKEYEIEKNLNFEFNR